jgi:hypothetical protein
MRCVCCNARLTDYEATRRHSVTNEFLDLCGECFHAVTKESHIPSKDRPELLDSFDELYDPTDKGDIDNSEFM